MSEECPDNSLPSFLTSISPILWGVSGERRNLVDALCCLFPLSQNIRVMPETPLISLEEPFIWFSAISARSLLFLFFYYAISRFRYLWQRLNEMPALEASTVKILWEKSMSNVSLILSWPFFAGERRVYVHPVKPEKRNNHDQNRKKKKDGIVLIFPCDHE